MNEEWHFEIRPKLFLSYLKKTWHDPDTVWFLGKFCVQMSTFLIRLVIVIFHWKYMQSMQNSKQKTCLHWNLPERHTIMSKKNSYTVWTWRNGGVFVDFAEFVYVVYLDLFGVIFVKSLCKLGRIHYKGPVCMPEWHTIISKRPVIYFL